MERTNNYTVLPGFRNTSSGVQLLHRSGNRRIWKLGSDVLIKESPYDSPAETPWDEEDILNFLHEKTTIPIQSVLAEWVDSSNIHFIMKENIRGEPLGMLWPSLSWEEKEVFADQTADFLKQLRNLTGSYMGRVNREPLVDQMMFNTVYPTPQGPFSDQDALWTAMAATLRGSVPDRALHRMRAQVPSCVPYTYTHGDLSLGNIIVHDGKVVGLIDWEWSGFFPVWWEHAKFRLGMPRWIERDWWEMLDHRMDRYPVAFDFMEKFRHLVDRLESSDPMRIQIGSAVLQELLDDVHGVPLDGTRRAPSS